MQFDLDIKKLRAANMCAGKEASRPYMQGVLVQVVDGIVHLIGCDGTALVEIPHERIEGINSLRTLIPSAIIEKMKVQKGFSFCTVLPADKAEIRVEYAGTIFKCTDILASFSYPDISRVWPTADDAGPTDHSALDLEYLVKFGKVNKELGSRSQSVRMEFNGPGGNVLVFPNSKAIQYRGLISAMRKPAA